MTVKYFAYLRDITGCKEEQWEGAPDVRALLLGLCEKHGAALGKKIFPHGTEEELGEVIIMVNGRHIEHLGGQSAALDGGDTVQIFPVVAGG